MDHFTQHSAAGFAVGCCTSTTSLALSAHPQLHSWQACCSSFKCRKQATITAVCRAGYSIWTGYSFKAPLLASAVACLVGNVAYSLSYDVRALWLLILARLVTGLGALLLA